MNILLLIYIVTSHKPTSVRNKPGYIKAASELIFEVCVSRKRIWRSENFWKTWFAGSMCTHVVYLTSIFYTGCQVVVVVVLHGSAVVLLAVSRYEGQTFIGSV